MDVLARSLAGQLRSRQPGILHTHDMLGLVLGAKLKRHYPDEPYRWIHDIHEYVKGLTDLAQGTRNYFYQAEKSFLEEPDFLTCVSPTLAKLLKEEQNLPGSPPWC